MSPTSNASIASNKSEDSNLSNNSFHLLLHEDEVCDDNEDRRENIPPDVKVKLVKEETGERRESYKDKLIKESPSRSLSPFTKFKLETRAKLNLLQNLPTSEEHSVHKEIHENNYNGPRDNDTGLLHQQESKTLSTHTLDVFSYSRSSRGRDSDKIKIKNKIKDENDDDTSVSSQSTLSSSSSYPSSNSLTSSSSSSDSSSSSSSSISSSDSSDSSRSTTNKKKKKRQKPSKKKKKKQFGSSSHTSYSSDSSYSTKRKSQKRKSKHLKHKYNTYAKRNPSLFDELNFPKAPVSTAKLETFIQLFRMKM